MINLIPLTIVLATVIVPMLFADRKRARSSVQKLEITMVVLALLWAVLCAEVYPRYVLPE